MAKNSEQPGPHLESAYRTTEAAEEYFLRHRKSRARRYVSQREVRIVLDLLRSGFAPRSEPSGLASGSAPSGDGLLILDAPCGAGRLTTHLNSAGFSALACDSSIDMIRRGAAEGAIGPDRCAASSLLALPFADRAFDGGVCIRFLHHLENSTQRQAVLGELRRVVAGPVVASVWTGVSVPRVRRSLKRALGRRSSSRFCAPLHLLRQDARSTGWRVEKVRYLFPFLAETAYLLLL